MASTVPNRAEITQTLRSLASQLESTASQLELAGRKTGSAVSRMQSAGRKTSSAVSRMQSAVSRMKSAASAVPVREDSKARPGLPPAVTATQPPGRILAAALGVEPEAPGGAQLESLQAATRP